MKNDDEKQNHSVNIDEIYHVTIWVNLLTIFSEIDSIVITENNIGKKRVSSFSVRIFIRNAFSKDGEL